MGRIGWFDALARRAVNDSATFRDAILDPLVSDLMTSDTTPWMYERYVVLKS